MYTGGVRVAKIVAQAAAKHLTPTMLELGGKNPCVVDNTARIRVAARRIIFGKFLNCGQTCIAPDYILVNKSVKEALISAMITAIQESYGGMNPSQMIMDISSIFVILIDCRTYSIAKASDTAEKSLPKNDTYSRP